MPASLFSMLGVVTYERQGDGQYVMLGQPPDWLTAHWPTLATRQPVDLPARFLFLAHFLEEDAAFSDPEDGPIHASGPWNETSMEGQELLLEAFTLRLQGRELLLIKPARIDQDRFRRVLQQSRELSLEHYALQQSIDQREVLLHCLIHDLSTPLAGARSSFSLLREDHAEADMESDVTEMIDLGLRQVEKAQRMLQELLDAYMAATQATTGAPDLYDAATETLALLRPTARERGVRLDLDAAPPDASGWGVAGDRRRLERVLFNLVDNALRYAPVGSTVTVRLERDGDTVTCQVRDAGPGVPPAQVPHLFRKFRQGDDAVGAAGLGLYFCRITVEGWGGSIGYRDAQPRGACFWFELPAAVHDVAS
ncbi:MAG: hypothetical protein GVY18_13945 [Bacteroidetes bacterium]|nr:hypothetical protein [Bacteroidota bacterium]